ncbi:MAG: hypothetical protein JKY52_11010 [Flavobacteriales bacterium]|nr:hypothetical protein [Flavobacteriales bacterium]
MYQENATGLYLTMGTILRIFANYSPMIYLGGGKKIANKFHFGGALEFGGYGRFNLSVDAKIQVKGFEVALGSRSLGGIVFPKRAGGNSAYVSLKKKF